MNHGTLPTPANLPTTRTLLNQGILGSKHIQEILLEARKNTPKLGKTLVQQMETLHYLENLLATPVVRPATRWFLNHVAQGA